MSKLDSLPIELVQQILGYLNPHEIHNVAICSRKLREFSDEEAVWRSLVNENLDEPLVSPQPAQSFRDLYLAHYPHWYLVKQKMWFADDHTPNGKLICVRYVRETGCIIGQQVIVQRRGNNVRFWEKDRSVVIHEFKPKIMLNDDVPVIKIKLENKRIRSPGIKVRGNSTAALPPYCSREVLMENFNDPGIFSSLVPALALPEEAITERTEVWPPLRFPSDSRTRNSSNDDFTSSGHRPSRYSELSQSTFRLRRWADYSSGRTRSTTPFGFGQAIRHLGFHGLPHGQMGLPSYMQQPQVAHTYATIPPSAWLPTPQKPYQGIWCGDYSGHGCELILITQPDPEDQLPLPEKLNWLMPWFAGEARAASDDGSDTAGTEVSSDDEPIAGPSTVADMSASTSAPDHDAHDDGEAMAGSSAAAQNFIEWPYERSPQEMKDFDNVPSGRLEAIKLTGDTNVPRGEYTFISTDIGHGGFIRVADEESFKGARIVRSAGHIAGPNFNDDAFTPSQLILLSHDRLAQLWEGFNHVSYFERVDIDALMKFREDWSDEPSWMTS